MILTMTEKPIEYVRVRSNPDPDGKPIWEEMDSPVPEAESFISETQRFVGDLRVENDDRILMIYFEDDAVRERVTPNLLEAAALSNAKARWDAYAAELDAAGLRGWFPADAALRERAFLYLFDNVPIEQVKADPTLIANAVEEIRRHQQDG